MYSLAVLMAVPPLNIIRLLVDPMVSSALSAMRQDNHPQQIHRMGQSRELL